MARRIKGVASARQSGAISCAVLVLMACVGCRAAQTRNAASLPNEYRCDVDVFRLFSASRIAGSDPMARELIELRRAVQATLGISGPIRPIEIYIFEDRAGFERFIAEYYPNLPRRRAFFMAIDEREVVYAFRDDKLMEDLRHEACHALLHSAVGPVPLWLDEGIAEYFETLGDRSGLHPRHVTELQAALKQGWRPSLTRLEGLTQLHQMTARDYGEAWGWVYWLLNDLPDGHPLLVDYLQQVGAGSASDPLSVRVFATSPRPDASFISLVNQLECPAIVAGGVRGTPQEM